MQSLVETTVDMTGIAARLRNLSSAEEFFAALGVAYDENVLRVARLHILKRMGEYLKGDEGLGLPDEIAGARAQSFLRRAYEEFAASSPLAARVFRVLKDHDPTRPVPPKTAFIAFDDIAPL